MKILVILLIGLSIGAHAQGLRGGSGTDIDNYCAVFNQTVIDTLKRHYTRWQLNPGWNKYRVALLGNSNTYSNRTWEPFSHAPTGVTNRMTMKFFIDTTIGLNSWVSQANCKGSAHGNQGGAKIYEIISWVDPMLTADKPMVATILAGTNNVNVGGVSWCAWPDTMEINIIINKLLAVGVMPILISIPPINDDDPSWTQTHESDPILIPYNNKLKLLAEKRGLPFIDLYKWCMDHGGRGLLVDWAHSNNCGANGADFTDLCLQGGDGGSFYNAYNYLMLIAVNDVCRYVVWDQPLETSVQNEARVERGGIEVCPNPFNPGTVITVYATSNNQGPVLAELYNMQGHLVQTLSAYKSNTNCSISIDGAELASGVYVVRVQLGNRQYVRNIVVQR